MPLFPSLPTPWAMLPDDHTASNVANIALSPNNTYIMNVSWPAYGILTGFRCRFISGGNGNCDMGLYDANANLLCHIGMQPTSSGILSPALANSFNLSPGRYYLAFWIDNATDLIRGDSNESSGTTLSSNGPTGAGGLPATLSLPLGNVATSVNVIGLLQNGWS